MSTNATINDGNDGIYGANDSKDKDFDPVDMTPITLGYGDGFGNNKDGGDSTIVVVGNFQVQP